MTTARDRFNEAQDLLDKADDCPRGTPEEFGFLLEGILLGVLAVGMGLGVHLEPLPGLDTYCLCQVVQPGEKFTHAADCPHTKPTNDEGPAASPTGPNA